MNLEQIQNWAQNGPMANDKQSLLLPALSVGASLAGGLMAMRKNPNRPITPGEVAGDLSRSQGVVNQMQAGYGQMQSMGQGLMDPNSAINQQQQQMIRNQSADQLAMQHMLARRQAAAMGQDSGITAAQNRAMQSRMAQGAMQQSQQAFMQNRMQGMGVLGQSQGLLGNIGRMQMGLDENIAQARLAERNYEQQEFERRNMAMSSMLGGIGSGLMGAYAQGIPK
tara:strand:+ start:6804 stop:7475 length:672 start_codon:yes stop_codon:yes gene_type:complete